MGRLIEWLFALITVKGAEVERLDLLYKDVCDWFADFNEPVGLRVLAQRHARRFKGESLVDLLKGDARFIVRVSAKTGGRLIAPREAFEKLLVVNNIEDGGAGYWKHFGAKALGSEL